MEAAEIVAEETGLPVEVVYLYNGRNGVSTFDTTIKDSQVAALEQDVPFLKSIGVLEDPVDVKAFVDDSLLRDVLGSGYDAAAQRTRNPAAISGRDEECDRPVKEPATAGEVWVQGEAEPRPVADATCLLRTVAAVRAEGGTVRASYVPDASPAPGGSPTAWSGCATAPGCCPSPRRSPQTSTPRATRAAARSPSTARWRDCDDDRARGASRDGARAARRRPPRWHRHGRDAERG